MNFIPPSRRQFIKWSGACVSACAAAGIVRPSILHATPYAAKRPTRIHTDDPRALAQAAIDAAVSQGAIYADTRITHIFTREFGGGIKDSEAITMGVRSLSNQSWGFASSAIQTRDEAIKLGTEASRQATSHKSLDDTERHLLPRQSPPGHSWTMPIRIDPFQLPVAEVTDFLTSLGIFISRIPNVIVSKNTYRCVTVVKTFAASDGYQYQQQTYLSSGDLRLRVEKSDRSAWVTSSVDTLSPAGVGWELYSDEPIRDAILRTIDEMKFELSLPAQPVDVGRFDTVMDAQSVASLLSKTVGAATELDRMLGYEANASGTSYLSEPNEMLGQFPIGSSLLQVTGNRNATGGAATVYWDDEGVGPTPFTIVEKGILNDVSTTRESGTWIQEKYRALSRPLQSNGCSTAESALYSPMTTTPNLALVPSTTSQGFDDLVANVPSGVAITQMSPTVDFQQLNGLGLGKAFLIKRGKRIAKLLNTGALFRTPELWKSLIDLGGNQSARRFGLPMTKGEPPQMSWHSVTAVPAMFKDVSIIDTLRKA